MEALSRQLPIRDLSYHLLEWRPPAGTAASGLCVLLVHGFADAAGSWADVAPQLAARGHRVVAPDLRGFGQTGWVGAGGYYHFADYVGDLDALIELLGADRLALVGHSMGGVVTTLYAGARTARVERLAVLEGLGPPNFELRHAPDRMSRWLDDMRGGGRGQHKPMTTDEALRRLVIQHPGVGREVLARRLDYLAMPTGDGRLQWRFDPMHRTTSPTPFQTASFVSFASRVTCPVLLVSGGPEGFHPPDESERAAAFQQRTAREIEDAGHMMHWTRPAELGALLVDFLG